MKIWFNPKLMKDESDVILFAVETKLKLEFPKDKLTYESLLEQRLERLTSEFLKDNKPQNLYDLLEEHLGSHSDTLRWTTPKEIAASLMQTDEIVRELNKLYKRAKENTASPSEITQEDANQIYKDTGLYQILALL